MKFKTQHCQLKKVVCKSLLEMIRHSSYGRGGGFIGTKTAFEFELREQDGVDSGTLLGRFF
jgi:hypothetical protein